jgi:GNAT superfamily N-acetyltransferase
MNGQHPIAISWCTDPAKASELGQFFADNVTTEYISHSELQGERALDVGRWRPDLAGIFRDEISGRVKSGKGLTSRTVDSFPILEARENNRIVGLAMVSFFSTAPIPYGMVEDVVVDKSLRARGIGKAILDWIADEARKVSCYRLFLESGFDNHHAHDFFHREGFVEISVVMMRKLEPPT